MNKKYYCTLFNSSYLTRGLAMYESLKAHANNFHLFIFAFDEKAYQLLKKINLEFVTIISLAEFEDEELLKVKETRSIGEYCWTCTPSTIKYCIEKYELDNCTYLDADLYFYSDPAILSDEMENKSVLITEHRYTPEYDQSEISGIYCVQFVTFKNDLNGMRVLNWWRDSCIEWCYAKAENGKFGDQKYLDDWTTRFEGIHVLRHLGGGVAPWNIQQYEMKDLQNDLIFYHFHNFKFLNNKKVEFGEYKLRQFDIDILYKPYLSHLVKIKNKLDNIDKTTDYHGTVIIKNDWKTFFRKLKRKVRCVYNIYDQEKLLG